MMMKWWLLILFFPLFLLSCKKDSFITSPDARVTFTSEKLEFDTLFVSSGSTYRSFKIKNENDQKLMISGIRILGNNSFFRLNVDGIIGPQVNNIEIEANDSVYVFVQVNIDPNANNLPFVIRDSIGISYNGINRLVHLEAWGQNAHFLRDKIITVNETWNNDLPYVILGPLVIDTGRTLIINKGCRIYLHADAPIVVDGTLLVNGLMDTVDRVYFRGDRLDEPYRDFPASWPGIFFRGSSKDNIFNYAVIKNTFQAIGTQDLPLSANPKIILNECIIDNAYSAGIIAVNSSIRAQNCLISNCGKNIYLVKGGDYQFTHCTAVSYGNGFIQHRDPVLLVSNFINENNIPASANLNAVFRNCIFWGDNGILVDEEVVVLKNGNTVFNVLFDHDLWKVQTTPTNSTITQVIQNQDPIFDSVNTNKNYYNFRLKMGSPAINTGINTGILIDLDGKPRPVGLPDLGCYEFR
jgi:hypothetical protein